MDHDRASTPESGLFADTAFLCRALADENRLRILDFIGAGQKSVTQIAEELGLSQPLASHHLRELRRALLVSVERRGPFVLHRLSRPDILTVARDLSRLAGALIAGRTNF